LAGDGFADGSRHRLARQPTLVRGLGVALNLFERLVSADGGYLMRSAAGVGEPASAPLCVGHGTSIRAVAGVVAPSAKLFAEIVWAVTLAALCRQQVEIARRRRIEDRLQLGVNQA
jgi:hypothetical protein